MGRVKRRRAPRVTERPRAPYGGHRMLLDTHALIWWLSGDARLSPAAHQAVATDGAEVLVSAASAWELATKVRLGKLSDPHGVADALGEHIASQGFRELAITLEHGRRAGSLPGPHKDPFDRMLIIQAQAEGVAVVSNDGVFDAYGIPRIW